MTDKNSLIERLKIYSERSDYASLPYVVKEDCKMAVELIAQHDATLQVWFGAMPESNGKSNWTAILHTGDIAEGFTLARSEYKDRVRYSADSARFLIGELADRPDILAYDGDLQEAWNAAINAEGAKP